MWESRDNMGADWSEPVGYRHQFRKVSDTTQSVTANTRLLVIPQTVAAEKKRPSGSRFEKIITTK